MGLISGLVSTVVHAASGRNPYGQNHNQAAVADASGHPAGPSHAGPGAADHNSGCNTGPGGRPCGICAVAAPFGKGRQQKMERRAMRHERRAVKHAMKAQRFSYGRHTGYLAPGAGPYQQQQQQVVYRGGPSMGQEECVEGVERQWEERRRASTGGNVPPPAYEEGESSAGFTARRSVEVLGGGDEKRGQEKA